MVVQEQRGMMVRSDRDRSVFMKSAVATDVPDERKLCVADVGNRHRTKGGDEFRGLETIADRHGK